MKKVKIAVLGLGNVGSGVWKILNTNMEQIKKRSGYDIEIAKVLVRDMDKKRSIEVPKGVLTTDMDEILEDEAIRIVVELIGGIDPAKNYMLQAMRKKKHVVTANKLVVASMGDELIQVAKEEGVMFFYEASVAGGIPIIHGINESLTANKIEQIVGIINGTTNYILTKMSIEGMSFEDALREAQEKGYAEADPTSDVEAYDAVYKLAILSSLGFGTSVKVDYIYREGITNIKSVDIEYAREFGYVIKLLAVAKDHDGVLELRVHPAMIPARHPLANVNDSFNAVFIKGNAIGDLMLYGRGAGELPTGSAVVGDIISILRNGLEVETSQKSKSESTVIKFNTMEQTRCEYYIRITVKDIPGTLGEISSIFGRHNVSLSSVIQKSRQSLLVPLVFVTHETVEVNIKRAIEQIKEMSTVHKVENIIRVEKF
jgi:homoserine dehydrogenase